MTRERIDKLETLGIDWDPFTTQWKSTYELLRQYKKDKGDSLVPKSYAVDGVALGHWVHTQRQEYRKLQEGKQSAMTCERIDKLETLGIDWDPFTTQWKSTYELLRQYYNDKGDCRVPTSYAVNGVALGQWVRTQRQEYWKLQDGKPSSMTRERIDKLEAVGIDWHPLKKQWNSMYELLQLYKKDKGNCRVPKSYAVDGVALGVWVAVQRVQYRYLQDGKLSAMTRERIDKLETLGIDWDPFTAQWNSTYELLWQYYNDKGDSLVPQHYTVDGVALYEWTVNQRTEYRKLQEGKPSQMTEERINKLEAVDFDWSPSKTKWNLRYELLRQYYNDKGNCRVPRTLCS